MKKFRLAPARSRWDAFTVSVSLFWQNLRLSLSDRWHSRPAGDRARRQALDALALAVPSLLRFAPGTPFVIGGAPSWGADDLGFSASKIPAIPLSFPTEDVYFVWGPVPGDLWDRAGVGYKGRSVWSDSLRRAEVFRRRLRTSRDVVPRIPVWVEARMVLALGEDEDLWRSYLDSCWQRAVLWSLRQVPPVPPGALKAPVAPGTWESRRLYLEEALNASLMPLTPSPPRR